MVFRMFLHCVLKDTAQMDRGPLFRDHLLFRVSSYLLIVRLTRGSRVGRWLTDLRPAPSSLSLGNARTTEFLSIRLYYDFLETRQKTLVFCLYEIFQELFLIRYFIY